MAAQLPTFRIKVEVSKLNVFNFDLHQLADARTRSSQKSE